MCALATGHNSSRRTVWLGYERIWTSASQTMKATLLEHRLQTTLPTEPLSLWQKSKFEWQSLRETSTALVHIERLVQEKHNSSALAVELHLSCINPSI